jgi:hypothetical protein
VCSEISCPHDERLSNHTCQSSVTGFKSRSSELWRRVVILMFQRSMLPPSLGWSALNLLRRESLTFLFCTWVKVKVKVKVKLSLCCNWAQRHEGVWGEWMCSPIHSLTSALDGGEWAASSPGRFTPRERAAGSPWIGDWVGPRAVLDAVVKRIIPSPRRESNPRTPIV